MIITIDGPASSGKGTVAKILAKNIQAFHLDSGLLYRALAYFVLKYQISSFPLSEAMMEQYMTQIHTQYSFEEQSMRISLCTEDITSLLRTQDIGSKSSEIAQNRYVRDMITEKIQSFQKQFTSIVADGRDMGTVVFPHAQFHFYLEASLETRALRRHKELIGKGLPSPSPQDIAKEIAQRDYQDTHRLIAPLKPSDRSIIVDTDRLTPDEIVQFIQNYMQTHAPFFSD
jgi:cytidylate kinase